MGSLLIASFLLSGAALAEPVCPGGIGAEKGSKPSFVHTMKSGKALIVCGAIEGKGQSSIHSEFDLYESKDPGSSPVNPRSIFTASALQNFRIKGTDQGLLLTELAWIRGALAPVFEHPVVCDQKGCVRRNPKCVLIKPMGADPKAIEKLKAAEHPDDKQVDAAFDLALSGSKEAIKVFRGRSSVLRLDGAAAESFNVDAALVRRLNSSRCL